MIPDDDFGFIATVDKKNRVIIPAPILERKKILNGQELFIQKCGGKIYIMTSEPDGGYIVVPYKKLHGMTFPERAEFNLGERVRILEHKEGIIIYSIAKE